jgi:hypothetical protein
VSGPGCDTCVRGPRPGALTDDCGVAVVINLISEVELSLNSMLTLSMVCLPLLYLPCSAKPWCGRMISYHAQYGVLPPDRSSRLPPVPPAPPFAWPDGLEPSVQAWAAMAPQTVDNYIMRHLLGRHAFCSKHELEDDQITSAFTAADAVQAAATLLQFNYILSALAGSSSTGHSSSSATHALTDTMATYTGEVVLRLGLGWPHSLQTIAGRHNKKVCSANL